MDQRVKPTPQQIRQARLDNPKLRDRDLAAQLGISEAELVSAHCGDGVVRIEPRVNNLLTGLEAVGEVMALTRNESAVHEKIGIYDKVVTGTLNALVLGEQIDLRIFPNIWAHGFAVEKRDGGDIRRSLQFFDAAGDAVHKVHLRPASNLYAYQKLVAGLASADQGVGIEIAPAAEDEQPADAAASVEDLRDRWSRLTDVHQFHGMLRSLKLGRREAVRMVGQDYAWQLECRAVETMMQQAAQTGLPIMCFVGNRGCIQIHSGPVKDVALMGPWLNVMDESFHLHLRLDHISESWAVRKPTRDGHVTSIEAYDAEGRMIIQFFSKRHEGEVERGDWRAVVEALPRMPVATVA
jgi:putative hemin transport protein